MRAAFTTLGMALATAVLVVSLFTRDTMEQLIDVTYFLADRQDATIGFVEKLTENVVMQVARLPGVLAAEPFREPSPWFPEPASPCRYGTCRELP